MRNIKICILGNSVALRVRPPKAFPKNKNYTQLLNEKLNNESSKIFFEISNIAHGASTTYNATIKIDSLIQQFPDYYILNFGVVDASTREIPLWFYRVATSKKNNILTSLSGLFYRNLLVKIRPFLVNIRFKRSWVSKNKFKKYFELLVNSLVKETNAKLIVLPINIANQRVEKQLPGTQKRHILYNQIIKDLTMKYDQRFIELEDLNSEEHYPDGIHYSVEGHKIVAERIANTIIKPMQ